MKKFSTILVLLIFLYFSNNYAQWRALNTSFGKDIKALLKFGNGLFASTDGNGIYYSADSEQNWVQKNSGLTNLRVLSLASNGTAVISGTYGNGVFVSNDNGNSWTSTGSGISVPYIYALAFLGNNIIAGTGGGGFFRSSNNGSSWTSAGGSTHIVNSIYVTSSYAFIGQGPYAYKSTDNGNTWTTLIGSSSTTVKGFAETPKGSGGTNIFVGALDGVYLSTDNGSTWKKTNSGLSYTNVNAIVATGQNLFVATESGGVYRSSDNGTTWSEINTGLPANTNGRALILSGGYLYLGTSDGVVWKRSLSDFGITSVENMEGEITSSYKLNQNYPNPFNPSTKIQFAIPASQRVSLKVFDITGREVANLVDEFLSAGNYSYDFDGTKLSSGIYFYRLISGNFSEIRKMTLIK